MQTMNYDSRALRAWLDAGSTLPNGTTVTYFPGGQTLELVGEDLPDTGDVLAAYLSVMRAEKMKSIDADYEAHVAAGFTVGDRRYSGTIDAQADMIGLMLMLQSGMATVIEYAHRDPDGVIHVEPYDAAGFSGVIGAGALHKNTAYARLLVARGAVNAAMTVGEINAVEF